MVKQITSRQKLGREIRLDGLRPNCLPKQKYQGDVHHQPNHCSAAKDDHIGGAKYAKQTQNVPRAFGKTNKTFRQNV